MSPAPNHVELLVDGHEILPALLADIRLATKTIHVSMFLWFYDPVGEELADLLIRKAGEGVTIRVLLNVEKTAMGDPFSTGEKEMISHDPAVTHDPTDVKPLCKRMTDGGIEVVDTNIDYDAPIAGLAPRLESVAAQIRDTIEIDDLHIDHRKIIVIDGRVGYCGGANVGAQYMFHVPFDPTVDAVDEGAARKAAALNEPWWKWHDSLTRFEGPIAAELDHFFHERFVLDGGKDFTPLPFGAVTSSVPPRGQVVASARIACNEPDERPNAVRELYVRLIRASERSIFIENPYFYHPALVDALCETKAARPDLSITLVLPALQWNDNEYAHDAQQHEYARYIELGIDVYEYQNHFNHLKMAVFDELHSIHGSTNGNYRSLEDDKDFELVVHVEDAPLAKKVLERVRYVDVKHAKKFSEADLEGGLAGFRVRHRDPRTLLLVSRRVL